MQTTDYTELIDRDAVNVVMVFSAWQNHFDSILHSLKKKKPVATEVGGAYSVKQCNELVKVHEETETPFMMLENCCFGREKLMVLNMAKQDVFGSVVHCDGGYMHDLREEISTENKNSITGLGNILQGMQIITPYTKSDQ